MKRLFRPGFDKVFFCAFLILSAWIILGNFSGNYLFTKSIYPLFIPIYLIFFFLNNKNLKATYLSFLAFCFLADLSFMLFKGSQYIHVSSTFYIIGFMYLFFLALPKFKIHRLNNILRSYFIIVLLISVYLLYVVGFEMNYIVTSNNQTLLFSLKSLSLILLVFIAFGIYLCTETKESVLFLTGVILINMSSVLGYINLYYIYHWSFEMIDKLFYIASLYFIIRSFNTESSKNSGNNTASLKKYIPTRNLLGLNDY